MADRELLEAAARAAGIEGQWDEDPFDPEYSHNHKPAIRMDAPRWWWNPLEDDGDALRLAVRLRMVVSLAYCTCCAVVDWADNEDENEVMVRFGEDFPDREAPDALAATRRAIVRAAAAIGGHHG